MRIQFGVNLYDKDGDLYGRCVNLFLSEEGKSPFILSFDDLCELRDFADEIKGSVIPEIVENCFDELSESDQAEFGP